MSHYKNVTEFTWPLAAVLNQIFKFPVRRIIPCDYYLPELEAARGNWLAVLLGVQSIDLEECGGLKPCLKLHGLVVQTRIGRPTTGFHKDHACAYIRTFDAWTPSIAASVIYIFING